MPQIPFIDDLNIIARSNLTIELLNNDLNIIQGLDDEPNDVGGLTAQELKAKFDEAGLKIQKYINEKLVPACLSEGIVEQGRVQAEQGRVNAETARVQAESARVSAESARVQAEQSRVNAETARAQAEQTRVNKESSRVNVEQSRVDAEAARVQAEQVRVNREDVRIAAEQSRVNAESFRAQAEQFRTNAEATRAQAEQTRVNKESSRVNAEAARVQAEKGRVSEENARVSAEKRRMLEEQNRIESDLLRTNRLNAFFDGISASAVPIPDLCVPSVSVRMQNGSTHFSFEIPRGTPGKDGKNFEVLAHYDTLDDLLAAHPSAPTGDVYTVGFGDESSFYIWDTDAGTWKCIGRVGVLYPPESGLSFYACTYIGDGSSISSFTFPHKPTAIFIQQLDGNYEMKLIQGANSCWCFGPVMRWANKITWNGNGVVWTKADDGTGSCGPEYQCNKAGALYRLTAFLDNTPEEGGK